MAGKTTFFFMVVTPEGVLKAKIMKGAENRAQTQMGPLKEAGMVPDKWWAQGRVWSHQCIEVQGERTEEKGTGTDKSVNHS